MVNRFQVLCKKLRHVLVNTPANDDPKLGSVFCMESILISIPLLLVRICDNFENVNTLDMSSNSKILPTKCRALQQRIVQVRHFLEKPASPQALIN